MYLNSAVSCLYWTIGNYIINEIQYETYPDYSQQLFATLSQTLSWSHFIKFVSLSAVAVGVYFAVMPVIQN
jgi:hypothetical protein